MYSFRRCILSEDVFFQKMYSFRRCILSEDVFFQKIFRTRRRCNNIYRRLRLYLKIYSFRRYLGQEGDVTFIEDILR
ncbi:hypothetical protein [European catfish virus]|uniref:Uncharacterized protein n=1 Tax=European catfish virus TaxID=84739 RepID=I2BFU7_9VIRU|nr:hypothetical protein A190_gp117 [European catfish virus]AFJ52400.1 hypothetical protein [European catfish virus]AMZ04946.1 hypothetical protein [European catfish virus]AMZ05082.1 hypothetical protein [European catfish virus]